MKRLGVLSIILLFSIGLLADVMVIQTTSGTIEVDLTQIESVEFSGLTDADFNEVINQVNFQLAQNYPNPFNPTTNIRFSMQQAGDVNLTIFNTKGQKVKTLVNGAYQAGEHLVNWNGRDENNKLVSSNVYFYKMSLNGMVQTKKMIMLK